MNKPTITIYNDDCLNILRDMPDNSVDSVVTDPPYGINFMGKKWDYDVPDVEIWQECLRVLKPGGHLLAFAGTRTQHRMAVRIEDAGFEIRDMIAWVYGSGFPKSLDVSKAIDKAAGAERVVLSSGKAVKRMIPGADQNASGSWIKDNGREYVPTMTEPATDAAKTWQGWGTALKPALEPITVARKPLAGTVAANVAEWGTGALNIDGCRVPTDDKLGGGNTSATVDRSQKHDGWQRPWMQDAVAAERSAERSRESVARSELLGRWPANVIHDGSDEVVAAFPESKGQQGDVRGTEKSRTGGEGTNCYGEYGRVASAKRGDTGSAARFFYCAKVSRKERNEGLQDPGPQFKHGSTLRQIENSATNGNNHPTVKPTELMKYLCRLVTPPNGTILDPFMGSGSTGKAAIMEGFNFIGCELDEEYYNIAKKRVEFALEKLHTNTLDDLI